MNARRLLRWSLVVIWMMIIFSLSHQPAVASDNLSSGFLMKIEKYFRGTFLLMVYSFDCVHFFIRKSAHFIIYSILGMLLLNAFEIREKNLLVETKEVVLMSLVISVIYATSDEIHQMFVLGRSADFKDVLIDSVGALFGIKIYYMWWKKKMIPFK